jgi:hypothetical protein
MIPTVWDWTVNRWFELTPLSSANLHQIVKQLNHLLRPEGHFSRLIEQEGRVFIGARPCGTPRVGAGPPSPHQRCRGLFLSSGEGREPDPIFMLFW